MDRVSNDRCLPCVKEGSAYHRLYDCEAHERTRLELPRDIRKLQQQAVTSKERLVWGKMAHSETN